MDCKFEELKPSLSLKKLEISSSYKEKINKLLMSATNTNHRSKHKKEKV